MLCKDKNVPIIFSKPLNLNCSFSSMFASQPRRSIPLFQRSIVPLSLHGPHCSISSTIPSGVSVGGLGLWLGNLLGEE